MAKFIYQKKKVMAKFTEDEEGGGELGIIILLNITIVCLKQSAAVRLHFISIQT
jgi:hypothetical protein